MVAVAFRNARFFYMSNHLFRVSRNWYYTNIIFSDKMHPKQANPNKILIFIFDPTFKKAIIWLHNLVRVVQCTVEHYVYSKVEP